MSTDYIWRYRSADTEFMRERSESVKKGDELFVRLLVHQLENLFFCMFRGNFESTGSVFVNDPFHQLRGFTEKFQAQS